MTRDDILKLEAGQDFDLLIAKEVLHLSTDEWNKRFFRRNTHYTTDIAAAWEVVEKLRNLGYRVHLSLGEKISITLDHDKYNMDMDYWIEADTAPVAICRAALLAVAEK